MGCIRLARRRTRPTAGSRARTSRATTCWCCCSPLRTAPSCTTSAAERPAAATLRHHRRHHRRRHRRLHRLRQTRRRIPLPTRHPIRLRHPTRAAEVTTSQAATTISPPSDRRRQPVPNRRPSDDSGGLSVSISSHAERSDSLSSSISSHAERSDGLSSSISSHAARSASLSCPISSNPARPASLPHDDD